MLFSGFFLNTASVPDYFIWLEHVSFVKYAFGGAGNAIFMVSTVFEAFMWNVVLIKCVVSL